MMHRSTEFPDTYLPGVARAADQAMREVLGEDKILDEFLSMEVPSGLRPARRGRR
jgi:hypothetical protein